MALDLFFVTRKPGFSELRSPDFVPTPTMAKARNKLVAALLNTHPGTSLQGDSQNGYISAFPRGELSLLRGCIHWSLHHVEDPTPIHQVVDWFLAHGLVCEDPQDAGFGNRDPTPVSDVVPMHSFDALVGAGLLGFRFDRNWGTAVCFDWTLSDGRQALMRFHHLGNCRLPELTPLVDAKVVEAVLATAGMKETLTVRFSSGHELIIADAVYDNTLLGSEPVRRR